MVAQEREIRPQRPRYLTLALWGLRVLSLAAAALLIARAISGIRAPHSHTRLLLANAKVVHVEQRIAGQVDGLYEPPSPRYKTEVVLRFVVRGVAYEGSPQELLGYVPWQPGQEVVVYYDGSDPTRFYVSPPVRYSTASYLAFLACVAAVQGIAEYLAHRRKKNPAN